MVKVKREAPKKPVPKAAPKTQGALAKYVAGGSLSKFDPKSYRAALAASVNDAGSGGGGSDGVEFLTFTGKAGKYSLGRDKRGIDPESRFLVDPRSAVEGFICWKANKPVARHDWLVAERAEKGVSYDNLKDHGPYAKPDKEGWKPTYGWSLVDLDDPTSEIKFTSSTISAINTLRDVMVKVLERWAVPADEDYYFPIVTLGMTQFEAHGDTNWKPTVNIIGWVSEEEMLHYIELGDDGDIDDLMTGAYEDADGEVDDSDEGYDDSDEGYDDSDEEPDEDLDDGRDDEPDDADDDVVPPPPPRRTRRAT